jgi:uncharacterized protein YneF (UPF0154 family)
MKASSKVLLLIIGIIIVLGILLGLIIFGSQYALEKYKSENPRPVCNETTNETIPICYSMDHPNESYYAAYSGFVFVV